MHGLDHTHIVRYLKYDQCGQNNINSYAKMSAMRDGLNRTGIPIVFSYEPHLTKPIAWTTYVGNLWRTVGDRSCTVLYGQMCGLNRNATINLYHCRDMI